MPKIDLSESKATFEKAISYANAAERDQADPASANLLWALHSYFQSTAMTLIAIAKGIDDLDERLARLERHATGPLSTKLK